MKIAFVQLSVWDRPSEHIADGVEAKKGDKVVVLLDSGHELGEIVALKEQESAHPDLKRIVRKASQQDLERIASPAERRSALEQCKNLVRKHELPMKLVDVRFSFDRKRMTFAFIADGRVDFRELVKDLTKAFNCVIRLQQIGIRDEAKLCGDFGHCGMPLCCGTFLSELASITSDMADIQQCSHRGSDRISGICGRLMCCLAYEQDGYREKMQNLPPIGEKIRYEGRRGTVIAHHILKQTVDIELDAENGEGRTIVEADLSKNKEKKQDKKRRRR